MFCNTATPLVPYDWVLIRLSPDDYIYELAKGVYTLDAAGKKKKSEKEK